LVHDENLPPNLHEGMNPAPAAASEIDNSVAADMAAEDMVLEDVVAAGESQLIEPVAEAAEAVAETEEPVAVDETSLAEPPAESDDSEVPDEGPLAGLSVEAVQQLGIEQLVLPVIPQRDDEVLAVETEESGTLLIKDDYVAGNLDFSPEGEPHYVPLTGMLDEPVAEAAEPVAEAAEPVAEAAEPVAEAAEPVAEVLEPVAQTDEIAIPVADAAGVSVAEQEVVAELPPVGTDEPAAEQPASPVKGQKPKDTPAPPIDPAAAIEAALNPAPQQIGGIEILIQMAEKGEIDAKNIDIIDVTDRFLKAIAAAPKENLRQSGKIIFQASILLRMKAEALLAAKVEDEFGFGDDYVDFDIDGSPIMYDANHQPIARQITLADLERALVRQTKLRQMRHRRVTLEQLIEALREAERLEAARGERKVKPRIAIDGYNEMRDMDDILELAHDEDIEDVISRIERLLSTLLDESDLLPLLRIIESLGGRGDWVDAFLAVLFLSNAGKISLQQEKFYGPLFIIRAGTEGQTVLVPPAVPESEEPRAH
jgi:segregation and condensation protein A